MRFIYQIKNILAKSPHLVRLVRRYRPDAADRRRNKILHGIDIKNLSGLEFGALDRPIVKTSESNIKYADILSTPELKEFYKNDPNVIKENLVTVDFVIKNSDIESITGPFDFILASHVFEHVPNPIAWLQKTHSLLRPGGVLSLVIPDRRYTFDKNRPMSSAGQLLERYYTNCTRPSFANIFDQHYYWWKSGPDDTHIEHTPDAYLVCAKTSLEGEYHDVHCNIFTDTEFVDFINVIRSVGLTDFVVQNSVPCEDGHIEFFVQLKKPHVN